MKYSFSREYSNWICRHDESLEITLVESSGHDLEDLLVNATVFTRNWHGDKEEGPELYASDLSSIDCAALEREFSEYLATTGPDEPDSLALAHDFNDSKEDV